MPSTSLALHNHLDSLDNEITQLVVTQSTTNSDSLARISAAKAELADLLENIDTVRERAIRTEDAIAAMTADIKKLDSTKRNLTLSMTVLKRLQMLSMCLLGIRPDGLQGFLLIFEGNCSNSLRATEDPVQEPPISGMRFADVSSSGADGSFQVISIH